MPHNLQDNNTSRRCIQRKDDEEEICFIQAIEHAKSVLQDIKIALMDKQQARVPKKIKVEKETIKERKSDAVVEKEANLGANEKVVA